MAHKEGDRQHSYTKGLKDRPGGGKGHHNPYQWQKPKKALSGQRKGYNV